MYRNDFEAALARADAAERELAELKAADSAEQARLQALESELAKARAEVARLQPKASAKPSSPQPSSPGRLGRSALPASPRLRITLGAIGVLLTGGFVVALVFLPRSCAQRRILRAPGELDSAYVMKTGDGHERLLVVSEAIGVRSSQYGSRWRIDLVDPVSGHRLVRKVFNESNRRQRPELAPAGPGRIWCDMSGAFVGKRQLIEQCDLDTLEVTVSQNALIAKIPQLASGFAHSPEVDLGTGDLIVTTKSAETLIIGAADLVARPFRTSKDVVCLDNYVGGGQAVRRALEAAYHGEPLAFDEGGNCASLAVGARSNPGLRDFLRSFPRIAAIGTSQDGTVGSVDGSPGYSFQAVDGGPREGLFRELGDGKYQAVGEATYIHPEVLVAYPFHDDALLLPDHRAVLIHRDSLDDHSAKVLLSGLGLDDGKLGWTLTVPPCEVKMGHLAGDLVIVALRLYSDKQSIVLGISWQDGVERWRYPM